MNGRTALLLTMGVASLVGVTLTAEEPTTKPVDKTVLFDKAFRIIAPDGTTLGTWKTCAILQKDDKHIEIDEALSMEYRGRKMGYTSTVVYATEPSITPLRGSAETTVGGKPCMRGSVTVTDKTIEWECTGLRNEKTGEAFDPPKTYRKTLPRPEGVLLFTSALPTVAPRLLPEAGELTNVVLVEFPDDIGAPELIHLNKGLRLIRKMTADDGQFSIELHTHRHVNSADRKETVPGAHYDKAGRILHINSFGKFKVEPIEPASQPAASTPG